MKLNVNLICEPLNISNLYVHIASWPVISLLIKSIDQNAWHCCVIKVSITNLEHKLQIADCINSSSIIKDYVRMHNNTELSHDAQLKYKIFNRSINLKTTNNQHKQIALNSLNIRLQ
jgi:hypothetical protein